MARPKILCVGVPLARNHRKKGENLQNGTTCPVNMRLEKDELWVLQTKIPRAEIKNIKTLICAMMTGPNNPVSHGKMVKRWLGEGSENCLMLPGPPAVLQTRVDIKKTSK